MKILFDQNVPRDLSRYLPGHEVLTAAQMEWEELANGDLLEAAESSGFDIFITCDQSLRYQQNLSSRKIAIIEITKNNWPSIEPRVEEVAHAVNTSSGGTYLTVECPFVFRPRKQ